MRLSLEAIDRLEHCLRSRIVGQDHAIGIVAESLRVWAAGLSDPDTPVAVLLLAGPTGVGKTYLAEMTAAVLGGDLEALIRVDCGEYQEAHQISRLIGAPPGYVGHDVSKPVLSPEAINRRHHLAAYGAPAFLLFDEIEKAHRDLWNILLGIMGSARLVMGTSQVTRFNSALIFLTTNCGSRAAVRSYGLIRSPVSSIYHSEISRTFPPEFVGRITETIIFSRLTHADLVRVAALEIKKILDRFNEGGICTASVGPDVTDYVASQVDPTYGARDIRRWVWYNIARPLARHRLSGHSVMIDVGPSGIRWDVRVQDKVQGVMPNTLSV